MVYRRLIDKLLANLRQEVPPTDPMYLTVDEAILSLRWLTDEDFGQEVIAWETWFDEQNYAEDVVCKGFVRQQNECEDATYHWFLDVYLPNLRRHDPAAHELSEQTLEAEGAYIKLRQSTDEDFGYDADGWEIWLLLHRFDAEEIDKGSHRRGRRPNISDFHFEHQLLRNIEQVTPKSSMQYMPKEEAYDLLKLLTKQDFGDDIDAWYRWIDENRLELLLRLFRNKRD